MGCNCGGKSKRSPGVGQAIPHQPSPASQQPQPTDRKADGRRRRYSVVGGGERRSFSSLGEARAWQRERGGRLR